tara:strand:+ start:199 stop:471 length:273 start_codon:yes stop_codon:yes gene_type:complete
MKIQFPNGFAKLTDCGKIDFEVDCKTIREGLDLILRSQNNLRELIYDSDNKIHGYINIYMNGEDIRFYDGIDTEASLESEVVLIMAVAGG